MQLPTVLDLSAAAPLWTQLCAMRGSPVRIDAAAVERVGGLCLQILIAAERQWRADGLAFEIAGPSAAYLESVRLMGVSEALAEGDPA